MISFNELNNRQSKFDVESKDYSYIKSKELAEKKVYILQGLWISKKSKFGEQCVFIIYDNENKKGFKVSAPTDWVEKGRAVLNDDDFCKNINKGCVGVSFYRYHSDKFNKDCVGVQVEPLDAIEF